MTGAVLDRPVCQESLLGGGGTLEELLCSALDEVRANGRTECPVCDARMTSTRASASEAGASAASAECSGCGSRLS